MRARWRLSIAVVIVSLFPPTTAFADDGSFSPTNPNSSNRLGPANEPTVQPDWLQGHGDQNGIVGGTSGRFFGVEPFALEFTDRLQRDFRAQLAFPFRYARRKPARFLLGAAGILTLILTDHHTQPILASRGSLEENGLIESATALSRAGRGSSAVILVMGLGAIGLLADSPRERETSILLIEAGLTSALWTDLIKRLGGRERPREREEEVADWEGPDIFNNDLRGEGFRSFPSGHSSGIWAVATILAHQYPHYKIVPLLSYGTAVAMSYSRMVVGAHWLSDVVVGGLIGYGCAKQVLSARRFVPASSESGGVRFGIDVTGDYQGVSLKYDF